MLSETYFAFHVKRIACVEINKQTKCDNNPRQHFNLCHKSNYKVPPEEGRWEHLFNRFVYVPVNSSYAACVCINFFRVNPDETIFRLARKNTRLKQLFIITKL